MTHDLSSLCQHVNIIVKEVGRFISDKLGMVENQQVETKDHNSLVSYVDKKAEETLVKQLSLLLPGSGFITEEETEDKLEEFTWIIDPLDGTTNFLYNIPHFSTSVALKYKDELVLGVISDIMRNDIFYAWKGGGSWMNEKRIGVSHRAHFSEAVIATGFPYASSYNKQPYFDMMEEIMRDARGMRRFGSAALDLAYVACGRFDAFYETSLNPWDVCGGIVICKEAGAIITDYFNGNSYQNGRSIIAASPEIHKHLVLKTSSFFSKEDIPDF